MNANERVIREFVAAWSRLDADELASYFTDDGVYHNVPIGPVQGRDNVRELIRGFIASWTRTDWEISNIACAGDVVFCERIDRTRAGDHAVDLPCTGVFEMESGKIKVWRDYFDMATYQKGMS